LFTAAAALYSVSASRCNQRQIATTPADGISVLLLLLLLLLLAGCACH
jgi:hypothetical protein